MGLTGKIIGIVLVASVLSMTVYAGGDWGAFWDLPSLLILLLL